MSPPPLPATMRAQVRPTADRGPILLCVDTSGSMRGARETVAKALALECMRAAREQERDCFVFAFSGPSEVSPYARFVLGCSCAARAQERGCSVPVLLGSLLVASPLLPDARAEQADGASGGHSPHAPPRPHSCSGF